MTIDPSSAEGGRSGLDEREHFWDSKELPVRVDTGRGRPRGWFSEHIMGIVLNTDDLWPNERGAFWRHVLGDTFAPVVVRNMADAGVAGSIRGHFVGRLLVTDVQGTAQEHHRTPRLIREADNAFFQLAIVADGVGRLEQDGRQAVLNPGDCVLYENTRPFRWKFDSDWDVWVFSLPSDTVRLSESERRHISARRLDGTTGPTGVVSRFLLDLARHSEDLPAGQSERILAHASDLVVTLLSDCLDDSAPVQGAVQRSLVLRIKDYIDQRLHDPALGPAEIAAAVNISPRYLLSCATHRAGRQTPRRSRPASDPTGRGFRRRQCRNPRPKPRPQAVISRPPA
jgi:AraC family transcriptional activator of tynA and feaB